MATGICNDPLDIQCIAQRKSLQLRCHQGVSATQRLRTFIHPKHRGLWAVTRENTGATEKVLPALCGLGCRTVSSCLSCFPSVADSMLGPSQREGPEFKIVHCVCSTSRLVPAAPRNNSMRCFCLHVTFLWPDTCLICRESRKASPQHMKLFCSADPESSCDLQSHCCTFRCLLENFASIMLTFVNVA